MGDGVGGLPGGEPGFDGTFGAIFAVVVLIMAVGIGVAVYRGVRMANRGQNPFTVPEDLAHRVSRSAALDGPRTKAERLAELDALLAAGGITAAEHADARARILAE